MLYIILPVLLVLAGCAQEKTVQAPPVETVDPSATIGSLARIYATDAIGVRGIGIVAGLSGTGSSECPASVRPILEKYIWQQSSKEGVIDPRAFINSMDTAVVEVVGTVPFLADQNKGFDVFVRPLSGTQTVSLDGGYLYTTELKEMSRLARVEQFSQYSNTIATAAGPIYANKMEASGAGRNWYVIGGGKSSQKSFVKLILNKPGFLTANAIRNRINERFGPKTCVPNSESECTLYFPARYSSDKVRFIGMINSMVLGTADSVRDAHTASAIDNLIRSADKNEAEIVLEAIGKSALNELEPLLKHPDRDVRFHAARCMLNIGSRESIPYLRTVLADVNSPFRIEAIRCIGRSAESRDSKPLLMAALNDDRIEVRLAAYEMLSEMESPLISRKVIGGGNFVVDSVVCGGPKTIYVYQQNRPRIVLFGSPIQCSRNLFIQSDDGRITLNAMPDDKHVSVSRKHPNRPRVIGPIKSSFELSLLLQTLGEMPEVSSKTGLRPGLAIPYADIVPLLNKLCVQNAVPAGFIAGPELKPESIFQGTNVTNR
jgi:flagellar basal body P-ring protein FlgI